jgi:hypothetical protein
MQQRKNNQYRNNNQNRNRGRNQGGQNRNQGGGQRRPNVGQLTNQVEKYNNQARDALHQGDRVKAEYYYQHADHYQRLLNEAQEEMARYQRERGEQAVQENTEGDNAASESGANGNGNYDAGVDNMASEEPQSIAAILPPAIGMDDRDRDEGLAAQG